MSAPLSAPDDFALPDAFALPEHARWVPLAVLANDAPGLEIAAFTAPARGVLALADGVLRYTPAAGQVGPDGFAYTARNAEGATFDATVTLTVAPGHEQPQRAVDSRIAAEIAPSGRTIELQAVATLPPGPDGQSARAIGLVSQGQRLFVLEQGSHRDAAEIRELTPDGAGGLTAALFLDLDAAVAAATGRAVDHTSFGHGGLRGLAFHPEFARNGLFYTAYMERRPADPSAHVYLSDSAAPIAADSVLAEWRVDDEGAVVLSSHREVFRVGMPVYDHPIKEIAFNPFARPGDEDYGLLYIGHGDGSEQSATAGGGLRNDALGKILRIDPRATVDAPFSIPAGNPFVGTDTMIDAAYSIGHRNPHNMSFARVDGGRTVLIVAEPGRDNFEEVNLVEKGGNYGWSDREGPLVHLPGGGGVVDGVGPLPPDESLGGRIFPAAFLGHAGDDGDSFVRQAIAGGFVVANGSSLHGEYVFADFAGTGRFFHAGLDALTAARTSLDPDDPTRDAPSDLSWATPSELTILFDHDGRPDTAPTVHASFNEIVGAARSDLRIGQGPDGSLWIVNKQDGRVYLAGDSLPPDDGPGGIVVRAAGMGGPAASLAFSVYADGVLVGAAEVPALQTNAQRRAEGPLLHSYAFATADGAPPDRVEIVFADDGRDALTGEDRNLWIDSVIFGGRAYEAEVDGHFTPLRPAAFLEGPREALNRNGTLAFDALPPPVLRVFAGGSGEIGSAPAFSVLIDGRAVGTGAIAAPQSISDIRANGVRHETFAFVVDDASPDRVEIVYANDGRTPGGENRNLYLRGIEIDGLAYSSDRDGVFVAAAPDLRGFNGPRQDMNWNGAMVFDLPEFTDLPIV